MNHYVCRGCNDSRQKNCPKTTHNSKIAGTWATDMVNILHPEEDIGKYVQNLRTLPPCCRRICQRKEQVLLSRVGDRPTATILHVQFHFLNLAWALRQNIRPKYAPPRRTNYILKWRGGEAAPPIYFIFTPSRRGIFWSNILP